MADEEKSDFLEARRSTKQNGRRTTTIGETCSICLSDLKDPTILSDCFHVFCYNCIIEWLKMKPECPLCKQTPKSFKYAMKLNNFVVPAWGDIGKEINLQEFLTSMEMDIIIPRSSYPADVERHAVMEVINQITKEQRVLRSMSHSAAGRESTYTTAIAELGADLLIYEHVLNMFPIASRREIFNEPAFRRVLYLRNLSPRSIVPPQYSVVFNLEYIKVHDQQLRVHLLPFISREMSALTGRECAGMDVMDIIFDYFLNKINRLQIFTFLSEQGIRHPHQFLNNLMHFAGTGQALAVYDQNSEYVPRSSNLLLSNVGGNDDVFVVNSITNNDVQVVGESSAGTGVRANTQRAEVQTREGVSQAIDRLRARQRNFRRRRQNPPDSIVDLSSSDSDTDAVTVENRHITGDNNANNRSQRFDNYVYTPTTDSWRREVPRILQPSGNRAISAIQMIQEPARTIETSSQRRYHSNALPVSFADDAMACREDGDTYQRGHVFRPSRTTTVIPNSAALENFENEQPSSSRNVSRQEIDRNDFVVADVIDLSDSMGGTQEAVGIKTKISCHFGKITIIYSASMYSAKCI